MYLRLYNIFNFQIIGRVQADPDYLPRSSDFGLNKIVFKEKFCSSCPESFWKIAFLCTEIDPEKRYSLKFIYSKKSFITAISK